MHVQRQIASRATRLSCLLVSLSLCLPLFAHSQMPAEKDVPWKAKAEILRRGDYVEHVDGFQSDATLAFAEAVAPPADDSGKFYVCVVTKRGCRGCEQLRADIEGALGKEPNESLKAWVNAKDYKQSWAHYQVFQIEDATQEQLGRWKNKRPTTFPCVFIQPPFNGSFGPPTNLVFWKEGYDGPEKLDGEMQAAVKKYCETVGPVRAAYKARQRALAAARERVPGGGFEQSGGKHDPPVTPPPVLLPPSVAPSIPPNLGASPEELRAAMPDAPAEFVLAMASRRASVAEAIAEWRAEKQRAADAEAKKKADELAAAEKAEQRKLFERLLDRFEKKDAAPAEPPKAETPPAGLPLGVVGISSAAVLIAVLMLAAGYGIRAALAIRARRKEAGETVFVIPEKYVPLFDKLDDWLIKQGGGPSS